MLNYSVLPDLIALSALVIVFRAMLRRHAGDQLDRWLRGWMLVLAYFIGRLLDVGHGRWEIGIHTITWLLLELGGIAFIRAASRLELHASQRAYLTVWIVGVLAYSACVTMNVQQVWPYWVAIAVMTVGNTARNFKVRTHRSTVDNLFSILFAWSLSLALAVLIVLHHTDYGVDVTLTWLYLMAGIRYAQRFQSRTTGVVTAVTGFFIWALVHPLGRIITTYAPGIHLEDEFWSLPKYIAAIGVLLTFLEAQIDRAEHLALHDPLTGLPNRRLFEDRLEKTLQRAERNQTLAAVLLVDMDDFKPINDTYGHATGDSVLCAAATRLQRRIRKADTIARTGGDEFSIILSDLLHPDGARVLARSLLEEMDQPLRIGERTFHIAASIGVAIYPEDARTADGLCALADAEMYAAKRSSKMRGNAVVEDGARQ